MDLIQDYVWKRSFPDCTNTAPYLWPAPLESANWPYLSHCALKILASIQDDFVIQSFNRLVKLVLE